MRPKKKYIWVLDINCDCGSYLWARSPVKKHTFPRCRFCKRSLDMMGYKVIWTGSAATFLEAEQEAKKVIRKQLDSETWRNSL